MLHTGERQGLRPPQTVVTPIQFGAASNVTFKPMLKPTWLASGRFAIPPGTQSRVQDFVGSLGTFQGRRVEIRDALGTLKGQIFTISESASVAFWETFFFFFFACLHLSLHTPGETQPQKDSVYCACFLCTVLCLFSVYSS